MKKINVEKLFKKLKVRKTNVVVESKQSDKENHLYRLNELSLNPWFEEILPSFQRK
jgi:hypothetical protein